MSWLGFAKGIAFGACFMAASGFLGWLVTAYPLLAMCGVTAGVVLFFGVMWGKYGAPWE